VCVCVCVCVCVLHRSGQQRSTRPPPEAMKVAYDPKIPYFSIDVECVATGAHTRECVLCVLCMWCVVCVLVYCLVRVLVCVCVRVCLCVRAGGGCVKMRRMAGRV
jgi:hypothetical protein